MLLAYLVKSLRAVLCCALVHLALAGRSGCGGPSCSAFMGTVSEAPSWGCLLAISGPYTERIFTVGFIGGLIGRSRKCAISLLHDCEVSHNHAVIELINDVLCIRDVGSTFGTYLNDKRLSEPKRASDAYKLKPCDSIKVGQTSLRWRPIGDIRRALMVCVPQPCGFPHDVLLRLPPATLSSDEQGHLLSTLTALYVQHAEVLPHPAPPLTHTASACEGPAPARLTPPHAPFGRASPRSAAPPRRSTCRSSSGGCSSSTTCSDRRCATPPIACRL